MKDLAWTHDQIVDAVLNLANYPGICGDTCGSCEVTANILNSFMGWKCPCGHRNALDFVGMQRPHENPTYGPTRQTIRAALLEAGSRSAT